MKSILPFLIGYPITKSEEREQAKEKKKRPIKKKKILKKKK